jgi:hypothetical protein
MPDPARRQGDRVDKAKCLSVTGLLKAPCRASELPSGPERRAIGDHLFDDSHREHPMSLAQEAGSLHVAKMLGTHPTGSGAVTPALRLCMSACLDCGQTCTICADACTAEQDSRSLVRCIGLNLDCAAICRSAADVLSRQTSSDSRLHRSILETCELASRACAEECEKHGKHMEHCRVCAEACRACEQACRQRLNELGVRS